MKWLELGVKESEELLSSLNQEFRVLCDDSMVEVRREMVLSFNSVLKELDIEDEQIRNNAYKVDYLFSLHIYRILNNKYHITHREASNNAMWRYLSLCVIPDIVSKRWGMDNDDRFWRKPNRVWLKTLWWYCHLAWQGNEKMTKDVLKNNSTDEILQLIDRTGRGGYRVALYREVMKQYFETTGPKRTGLFRKIMKLNTARIQVIEPELGAGGVSRYVSDLFEYFE